jgi:hypothetical protein
VTGPARAAAWVAHLREGGTTPWAEWTGTVDGPTPPVLPGAQQLELLRRVNQRAAVPDALVERVLTASAAGRGRPDLELVGARPASDFGPPPVDPADLPAEELLRVAALLLAEDLAAEGDPDDRHDRPDDLGRLLGDAARRMKRSGRGPWLRPWRTKYKLVGDPWRADALRRDLVARGRPPGGRGALVLVVADDLATMLGDLWTDRCFSTGVAVPAWGPWLDALAGSRRIARGADPVLVAATWSERVGRERVRIVLDETQLPAVLGVPRLTPRPAVSAEAAELARLVAKALGLRVTPDVGRRILRERLLPRLVGQPGHPGAPLAVPPEHHRWIHRRSVRMRDAVRAGDYPVVGEVDGLVSRPRALAASGETLSGEAADERVLALAVDLLLAPTGAQDRTGRQEAGT